MSHTKKNRVNLNSTTRHPCSLWYTCFPSTFVITWRNFNWNVSNNFHYLIDFLQPIFATQTSDLCFLCKNTGDKRSLFCCGRRQSSIWISNIILKVLIECWHVPVTGGYLPSHRNHLKYCEFLPFLQNFFDLLKCMFTRSTFFGSRENYETQKFLELVVLELICDIGFEFGFTNLRFQKMIYAEF